MEREQRPYREGDKRKGDKCSGGPSGTRRWGGGGADGCDLKAGRPSDHQPVPTTLETTWLVEPDALLTT